MNLARRSLESSAYNIIANGIKTLVLATRSILLARLLSPDDFGEYTLATSLIVLTGTLPHFGMGSAYLHRAEESEGDIALQVYFSLAVFLNLIWATVIGLIGYFLVKGDTFWAFWAILFTQVIRNLAEIGKSKLVKLVVFRRIALVGICITLGSTASALWLAWKGYGIWSLISTNVIATIGVLLGYYTYRPIWRPRLAWSSKVARYFLNFGKRTFLASVLKEALDHIDDLYTGFFLGTMPLGYYSRAFTFATYPRIMLASPLNTVAGSTYAELKNQPIRLSQAFFRVNAFLVRSGFLFAGLLSLVAPEFIQIALGEKWMPMLAAFRLMLVYTMLDPLKVTIANLFIAVGKPEIVTRARSIQLVVLTVGLFLLGTQWGIEGVALAVNIMLVVGIVTLLSQARAYVSFSARSLFAIPSLALVAGIGVSYLVLFFVDNPENIWKMGVFKTLAYCGVYGLVLLLLEREQIKMLWTIVRKNLLGSS